MRASEPIFVGRRTALDALEGAFASAAAGRGALVLATGEPGVGKTTLVERFAEGVGRRGARVLWGACLDGLAGDTIGPFTRALDAVAADPRVRAAIDALGAAAPVVRAALPSLRGAWPPVPLGPHEERVRTFDAIARLLRELARDAPVVLVVEDLHWADDDTLALLRYLIHDVARERRLLVATLREPGGARRPALDGLLAAVAGTAHVRVELAGLERDEVRALLSGVAGREVSPDTAAAVHRETSGIPFYVRELGRDIGGGAGAAAPASPGLRDHTAARLGRLGPDARELLNVAALLAGPADVALLAAMLGGEEERALDAVDEAVRAGFLRAARDGGYEVAHAILRRAITAHWLPDRLLRLRRRIATTLTARGRAGDAGEIAAQVHASRALGGAEEGLPYALRAADEARAAGGHERAAAYLHIAVDLAGERDRPDLLGRLAVAQAVAGRFEDAAATGARALALGASADLAATLAGALKDAGASPALWQSVVDGALARCPERDAEWARLEVLRERLEVVSAAPLRVSRWIGCDRAAVAVLRATGSDDDFARTVSPYAPRAPAETEALLARARAMVPGAAKIALLDAVVRDLIHRVCDYRTARAAAAELLAESQRIGHLPGEAEGHYELAKCHAVLGDLDAARASAARVPELVARLGPAHRLRFAALTALSFEIGYFGGVDWTPIAEAALRFVREPAAGQTPMGLIGASFGAVALAMTGERAAAAEIVATLADLLERVDPSAYQHKGAVDLAATAVWHLRLDDRAAAYERLERAAPADAGGAPVTCTALTLARMASLRGDRPAALRLYEEAAAWADARGAAPLAAVARHEHGLALGGRRGALRGRELIERALAEMRALRMTPWVAEAEKALGETARPLPDGLSAREAEVLAAVAAGLSNKDVAARLRISAATVQRHVAHVYRKIRVSNRAQATSYVARHELGHLYTGGLRPTT